MSEIKTRISADLKDAMKSKDNFTRDTLRMLNSAFKQVEVDERKELSDSDVVAILKRAKKQREEAAGQYQAAGRDDLYQKEVGEIEIISRYLPEQLSDEALRDAISGIILEVGATSSKDMGKVMGVANTKLSAQADGKRISQMAKELLSAL
ncbi:MAG: GatB/YqeY domain-containing protein [Wolinella sp.]